LLSTRALALDELGQARAGLVPGQLRRATAEPLDSVVAEAHPVSERRTVTRRLGGAAGHGSNVGARPDRNDREGTYVAPRATLPDGRARNTSSLVFSQVGVCDRPDAAKAAAGTGSRRQTHAGKPLRSSVRNA
jgi:hypothetical protein